MQLFLVFLVAVINLALGYALAVKFGWQLVGFGRFAAEEPDEAWPEETEEALLPFEMPATDSESDGEADDESADAMEESVPDTPKRDKGFLEQTFDGFLQRVAEFVDTLSRCDAEIREQSSNTTIQAITQSRTELLAAIEAYQILQQDGNNLLKDERDELGDLTPIGDRMEVDVDEHCEKLEVVHRDIDRQASEEDAAAAHALLLNEIANVVALCHSLRDSLIEGHLDIARHDGRMENLTDILAVDDLTGLTSRAGLVANISKWWRGDPERSRPISLAILDLDQFHQVNRQYGPQVGDRVLRATADALRTAVPEDVVSRVAGQRFALVFPSATSGEATDAVERCRQSIELSRFQFEETEIRLTASCVLMRTESDDTIESLFERFDNLVNQTKLQGRNRTVLCDDSLADSVEPPELGVDEQVIAV